MVALLILALSMGITRVRLRTHSMPKVRAKFWLQ